MGYAKLNFSTTVQTSQAMYDIVRLCTGNITTAASLTYASTTLSEVVNTLGNNWTLVYGTLDQNTNAYVISTPGITAGKVHYVQMQACNGTTWNTSGTFATAGAGVGFTTISSATSSTSVSNPAFYSTSGGTTGMGRYVVTVNASNTNIYLHWSNNHILLYGLSGATGATMFIGSFEYPENSLSQFTNTSPVIQYNYTYNQTTTFITTTAVGTGTTAAILFQGLNIHEASTNTTSGVYNLGVAGFGTVIHSDFTPSITYASDGTNAYPLVPYYWSLPNRGIPIMNISAYSGVYRMASNAASPENTFTVGSDEYVWLPLSTLITGGTQQAGVGLLKK